LAFWPFSCSDLCHMLRILTDSASRPATHLPPEAIRREGEVDELRRMADRSERSHDRLLAPLPPLADLQPRCARRTAPTLQVAGYRPPTELVNYSDVSRDDGTADVIL
jgi:hypothetical protein